MVTELIFEKVKDGVVCHNLSLGVYEVFSKFYPEFMKISDNGGFWPYHAILVGFKAARDTYVVKIRETS